jgi:hypothetical protein
MRFLKTLSGRLLETLRPRHDRKGGVYFPDRLLRDCERPTSLHPAFRWRDHQPPQDKPTLGVGA